MSKFGKHEVEFLPHGSGLGGEHATVSFPNGYKASIIRGGSSYFHTHGGTYEMAVLHKDVRGCVYDTGITDDVLPNLGEAAVAETLDAIEALPERAP